VVLCLAVVSASWWRHTHSLTADQVSTAVHSFTPTGIQGTTLQVDALASAAVHPTRCQPVTDLGLAGTHQQFSWWDPTPSKPPPNQLLIGRYPTGAAARQAWHSLITALEYCDHQPLTPARTTTAGSGPSAEQAARFNASISAEPRTLSQRVDRLWFWQLHSTEQTDDISLAARRYGNIIVICLGPPDATQQPRADLLRAFVEELAHQGRH